MKRFFRKALIWLARIAVVLIVLLIIFYAEEDWRGARDWAACQKELQAKGETLDLRQLAPPGKPEDDLSKAPIFAELYEKDVRPDARIRQINPYLSSNYSSDVPKYSGYKTGRPLDLAAWQKYYHSLSQAKLSRQSGTPAQDVLLVLNRFDLDLKEIDAAVNNPNAYFPINYEKPFMTTLGGVTSMIYPAQLLSLRAVAHLENHQTDLAEKDYLFSFRLNQPLTKGCFLVDYLVMAAVRAIDEAILWEGLRRHAWDDSQLWEMESELASTDMLAMAADSLRMERGFGLQTAKIVRGSHYDLLKSMWAVMDDNDKDRLGQAEAMLFLKFRPSGWSDREFVFYVEEIQKRIEAIRLANGTLDRQVYDHRQNQVETGTWLKLNSFLSLIQLGPLDNFEFAAARAETYRRLARLACRLEEYRITHGQYPEKLDELPDLPAHLNQEILSEQPLHYQRKGEGYLMYSIGWNQKDNGGVCAADDKEGNWVWPSP